MSIELGEEWFFDEDFSQDSKRKEEGLWIVKKYEIGFPPFWKRS